MSEDRERDYWMRHRAAMHHDAAIMARGMTANEQRMLEHGVNWMLAKEARNALTKQHRFEDGFVSIDCHPSVDSIHAMQAVSPMRGFNDMVRRLDAPYREHVREVRFWRAIYKLRKYPELQKTLRAIRTFRVRQKIISALKIKAEVYEMRFSRVRKILDLGI